jgi:hypothetical protein
VPHDKFNWEVFHLGDNIFQVKLPSKHEVQRLKIFGTYICQDRESCLSFDLWSSVDEPSYMLPEVWVRVSGVPSDMRSDYLSLWGVGTPFGKILDVDMAFTRKNKVLRIKIGCLDSRLILANSDVFIKRGFYKLYFEVENVQGAQEVNIVDANNGEDGNGDAHQGQGDFGGGNPMDMDHKGNETEATSNNNENEAPTMNNGVEGMQEQICKLDVVQIGTMSIKLNPLGDLSYENILSKNELVCKFLCDVENFALKDNSGADFLADLWSTGSSPGSPLVEARDPGLQAAFGQHVAIGQPSLHAASQQSCMQAARQLQQPGPTSEALPAPSLSHAPMRAGSNVKAATAGN